MRPEKSPDFWSWVCADPDVQALALHGADPAAFCHMIQGDAFQAFASENGGFVFRSIDSLGLVLELHTLFRREGWGREVVRAAREMTDIIFTQGCTLLTTHQQRDNWRSQPPRSHGWQLTTEIYSPSPVGDVRLWYLTPALWAASPIHKD